MPLVGDSEGSIFRKTRKKIKVSKKGCLSLHCQENSLFFQNLVGNKCAKYIQFQRYMKWATVLVTVDFRVFV